MTLGKGAKESAFRAGRCIAEPFQKRTSGHHSRSQSPAVHSCTRSCEMGAACPKSGTNFGRIIQATHSAASTNSFRTFHNSGGLARPTKTLRNFFTMKLRSCFVVQSPEFPFFRERENSVPPLSKLHTPAIDCKQKGHFCRATELSYQCRKALRQTRALIHLLRAPHQRFKKTRALVFSASDRFRLRARRESV